MRCRKEKTVSILCLLPAQLAAGMTLVTACPIALSDSIYASWSEGDFIENNPWTTLEVETNGYAYASSVRFTTGGNPNAYRQNTVSFTGPKTFWSKAGVLAINENASYTPPNNGSRFTRLAFACDENMNIHEHAHLVLVRDDQDKYYVGPGTGVTPSIGNWVSGSNTSIDDSDFDEINPSTLVINTSSHPDFDDLNRTFTFGYAFLGSHDGAVETIGSTGIDNWYVAVYRG